MNTLHLVLAILALLVTPGPTNSLLALAGARRGVQAALPLIPVEMAAYLTVITPLLIWGAPLVATLPMLKPILAGVAALWVARLAFALWRMPGFTDPATALVTARSVSVTTLLNPKALVMGLVLMPALHAPATALLVFVLILPPVSLVWITLGAGLLSRAGRWLNRGSALWLAALSLLLAARAMAG